MSLSWVRADAEGIERDALAPDLPMTALSRRPRRRLLATTSCLLLAAACGTTMPASPTTRGALSATAPSPGAITPPDATTTTSATDAGWAPVSTLATGVAVDGRSVTTGDGARVTMIRFRAGRVRFALHAGSQEPPTHGVT